MQGFDPAADGPAFEFLYILKYSHVLGVSKDAAPKIKLGHYTPLTLLSGTTWKPDRRRCGRLRIA
jgi:hypothetical protein